MIDLQPGQFLKISKNKTINIINKNVHFSEIGQVVNRPSFIQFEQTKLQWSNGSYTFMIYSTIFKKIYIIYTSTTDTASEAQLAQTQRMIYNNQMSD